VGLRDTVCPPSTVFAAYNQYGAATGRTTPPDRTMHVYPFNQHEGGEAIHVRRQLRWLSARMGIEYRQLARERTAVTVTSSP